MFVGEVCSISFTLRESDLCAVYPWVEGNGAPRRKRIKETVNE